MVQGRSSGLELAVGHAVDWHEPGLPSFLKEQPHAFATREVISAPIIKDLSLDIDIGVPPWQAMRGVALGMLADAALMPGCAAFEVRYHVTPSQVGAPRVQMFLTAKGRDWHHAVAQTAVDAACQKLPRGFSSSTPETDLGFGSTSANALDEVVIELRRDEEVTVPQWDYIGYEFYYTINDDPGDGSGWPAFWRSLTRSREPVTVSLLFQATELHWNERNRLAGIVTDLALWSEPHSDQDIFYNSIYYPACMNAKVALQSWQRRIEQMQRPLLTRIAVRGEVTSAVSVATALATAIGANSGTTGTRPMLIEAPASEADRRQADFSFDWLEILPWGGHGIWSIDEPPLTFRRMPYLFGLNEAASTLVLPVPEEQGVVGMIRSRRVETIAEESVQRADVAPSVSLGAVLHFGELGSPVALPLSAINRHALIVGAPGSGKTTTVMSLLAQLWRDHKVPFLVIESVKAEYRTLLNCPGLEDLRVITLGNESISPLRLNPLEPPPGVRCEVHISAVMSSLKMAMPLFPPLPQILAKALALTYGNAGWDDDTTAAEGLVAPSLRDLKRQFHNEFAAIGYVGEAGNIGLAFQTRLEGLLQGSRGKMLDTVQSSDFADIFSKPVVVEMSDIHDPEDKAILAAFLLDRIRAEAKRRGSTGGELRHVTVLEEAHRLLGRASLVSGDAAVGDQTRSDSVRAFCEAIAELRSLGEGFVLCSQSPSALAEAAVANTGARIVHRMESASDRKVMLDDLDASEAVRNVAARLRQGEAIARWPERDEVAVLKVAVPDGLDSGRWLADEIVSEHMKLYRRQVAEILPYQLCTDEVCTNGCISKVRRAGAAVASGLGAEARKAWDEAGPESIAELLARESKYDLQLAQCSAVHLSLQGDAFGFRPGRDDRPTVVSALRKAVRDGR